MSNIGFIGVGYMGYGIAKNIVKHGHKLFVVANKNRKPIEKIVSEGAKEIVSIEEFSNKNLDCLFMCVTNTPIAKSISEKLSKILNAKTIIIDIKGNESDTNKIDRNIIELLKLCKNCNNIYICSFNNFYIDILRLKQLKNVKIGYITSNSNIGIKEGIQFISMDKDMLNKKLIEKCVKENIEIITWAVRNKYEYNIIKNYNIDMIITEQPFSL